MSEADEKKSQDIPAFPPRKKPAQKDIEQVPSWPAPLTHVETSHSFPHEGKRLSPLAESTPPVEKKPELRVKVWTEAIDDLADSELDDDPDSEESTQKLAAISKIPSVPIENPADQEETQDDTLDEKINEESERTDEIVEAPTMSLDTSAIEQEVATQASIAAAEELERTDEIVEAPTMSLDVSAIEQGVAEEELERTNEIVESPTMSLDAFAIEQGVAEEEESERANEIIEAPTMSLDASAIEQRVAEEKESERTNEIVENPTMSLDISAIERELALRATPAVKEEPVRTDTIVETPTMNIPVTGVSPDAPWPYPAPHVTPEFAHAKQSVVASREMPPATSEQPPKLTASARRVTGTPLKWVLVLCLILVVGGIGEWIFVSQPWKSSTIITSVAYQNNSLGFSAQYAPDWQVDTGEEGKGVIHFQAAGKVVFIDVVVVTAQGDLQEYLKRKGIEIALQKSQDKDDLQFGGEQWKHIEGTAQQNSANYTISLLATEHGGRFYLLEQSAVQAQAGEMENVIFTPFRQGWKFL